MAHAEHPHGIASDFLDVPRPIPTNSSFATPLTSMGLHFKQGSRFMRGVDAITDTVFSI